MPDQIDEPPRQKPGRASGFARIVAAAGYSVSGAMRLWREPACRQEVLAAGVVLILFIVKGAAPAAFVGFVILALMVLATEALNSGLKRLEKFRFPVMYNDVTRTSFARKAEIDTGEVATDLQALARGETSGASVDRVSRDASFNGNLRTTCVATMLTGGHAENALAQKATATVNCRIFPGVDAREVQAELVKVVSDTSIHITPVGLSTPSPASPLRADVMGVVESVSRELWPGAVSIPIMENGATDGLFLRNLGVPVYGLSGPLYDQADDRAHGRDERVGVQHFYQVRELWYRMVKQLTGGIPSM